MKTFYVLDENRQQDRKILQYEGEVKAIACDFRSFAEDNSAISSVV